MSSFTSDAEKKCYMTFTVSVQVKTKQNKILDLYNRENL